MNPRRVSSESFFGNYRREWQLIGDINRVAKHKCDGHLRIFGSAIVRGGSELPIPQRLLRWGGERRKVLKHTDILDRALCVQGYVEDHNAIGGSLEREVYV